MAKFITGDELNSEIGKIIERAEEQLIIVSPYIKLHERIKDKLKFKIESDKLSNIRLHMGDAREVLRWLPEATIARAFILFPDPWPKRKHRKRRLVNPDTLALMARVMKPGAELRIGTDIADYARTMLLAFQNEPRFQWQAASPEDWRVRPLDWPKTRYEQKAEREGRVRYYFRFFRI